jgi:hypothetical protein
VAARAGEAGEVVGYRLNQREAAALAWYLRRAFPEVDAAQALPPLLEERRLEPSGGGVRAATARSFIVAGEAAALEELARLPGGEAIAAGETVVEKDLGRRKIRAVVAGEAGGG